MGFQSSKTDIAILSYRLGAPVAVGLDLGGLVLVLPSIYTGGKPENPRIAFRHEPLASVPAAPAIGAAEDQDRFCLVAMHELTDAIIEQLFACGIEWCGARARHPDRIGDRTMSGQPEPVAGQIFGLAGNRPDIE